MVGPIPFTTRRKPSNSGRKRDPIRDARCLELRAQGYSYPEIGRELKISHVAAREGTQRALRDWTTPNAMEVAAQESLKLYRLEQRYYPLALAGDYDAFAATMKIMERRAKLFGLDAPKKFDIRAIVTNWASDNGLDPEATLALVAGGLLPEE